MAERVAACFSSWQDVHVRDRGANVRDQLLRPLLAELFLALTFKHDDACKTVAALRATAGQPSVCSSVADNLAALLPEAVAVSLEPMPRTSDFVRSFEASAHWPALLAVINATAGVSCHRDATWTGTTGRMCTRTRVGPMRTHIKEVDCADTSPYQCRGLRGGNLVFAPAIGSERLHILHQLHGHRQCLRLIQQRESETGDRYDRVVWSRLEETWLLPHPPLSSLDRACAWIPFGEDYRGLNDRHALLPRAAADRYLGRYEALLDGRVMHVSRELAHGRFHELSEEKYLKQTFEYHRVAVCRFPAGVFLACCERKQMRAGCNSRSCLWRTQPRPNGAHTRLAGKYQEEIQTAIQQAAAASLPGATLVRQEPVTPAALPPPAGVVLRIVVAAALKAGWVRNMSSMYFKSGYRPGRAAINAAKAPRSRRAWGVAFVGDRRSAMEHALAPARCRLDSAAVQEAACRTENWSGELS